MIFLKSFVILYFVSMLCYTKFHDGFTLYLHMLQTFTSPRGSTDRIPLTAVGPITSIKITRISLGENDQEEATISNAFFGCFKSKSSYLDP